MFCERCKHLKEIREILAPCAECAERAKCRDDCDVRKRFGAVDRYCSNCDAGTLHGDIHFDGASGGLDGVVAKVGVSPEFGHSEAAGSTALDAEVEDRLRIVLAEVMQLDPVELLLVRDAFAGRAAADFCETLRKLRDRLSSRYDLRGDGRSSRFRSVVSSWTKRIGGKVPALADVLAANKRKGGMLRTR